MKLFLGFAALVSAQEFRDTPQTTALWQLISKSDASRPNDELLENFLFSNPGTSTARSGDKRGGAWWAWEYILYLFAITMS